jgi:hypothetical protein
MRLQAAAVKSPLAFIKNMLRKCYRIHQACFNGVCFIKYAFGKIFRLNNIIIDKE